MEINQNNLSSSSLSFDIAPELSENKEIFYGLNLDITSQMNSEMNYFVQNVNSNKLCFDFHKKIEGVINLDDDTYAILFNDEISLFDAKTCTNISLVIDNCLNIKNAKGVYKYNRLGRTIYFIDDNEGLRIFNIDKPYPKLKVKKDCNDCNDEFTLRLDCDALKVWKNVKYPKLNLSKTNGRLPSGKYQIAICFTQDKLRLSDYFIYPNIFTVSPKENNALVIKFDCFNQYFEQYELVLISHLEDRGTVAQTIAYLDTSVNEFYINEVDSPNYTPLDLKVLNYKKPYFQRFKHIEVNGSTTEGNLILGGLEERKPINYWKQAFNIKAKWIEIQVPAKDAHKFPSFMRDEVYSFDIAWLYKDGQISSKTHIPNTVVPNDEWLQEVNNDDTWSEDCNYVPKKYWEIYNTATVESCTLVNRTKEVDICTYQINIQGTVVFNCNLFSNGQIILFEDTITSNTTIEAEKDTLVAYGFFEDSTYEIIELNCRKETIELEEQICVEEQISQAELCNYKITNKGNFAFWESKLTYPSHSNFITEDYDYRCKGIRHFKFPDNKISNHHTLINGKEYVNLLGIQFLNIEKPKDCEGNYIKDIVGYIIYVTDRTNHKSILYKGMLSNMWEEELSDCTTSYYNNYPFNDLHPDVFLSRKKTHGDIRNSFKPVYKYSKDRFTFISPDTDYIRNNTAEELILYSEENGSVEGSYLETKEFPLIKFLSDSFYGSLGLTSIGVFVAQLALNANVFGSGSNGGGGTSSIPLIFESFYKLLSGFLPYNNYAINYHVKGNYNTNNFNNIKIGNKRRKINYANYLLPSKQIQDNDKINNNQREQGIYLKLNKTIENPYLKEYSRIRRKDTDCKNFSSSSEVFNPAINKSQLPSVSSYYVGFKIYKPTQYGNLNNNLGIIKYFTYDLEDFNTTEIILGGDIYITKHKKLRKFPFFTNISKSGYNDVGIEMSKYFNVWKPRFYMDYVNKNPILGSVKNLPIVRGISDMFDKSPYNFEYGNEISSSNCVDEIECVKPTSGEMQLLPNVKGRLWRNDGCFYTHVTGIQEYWCESEFISDFREINNITESNLEVDSQDLVKYNRIENPEISLYNLQYLWQGIIYSTLSASTNVSCCCETNTDYTRVIFSQNNNIESLGDKWLSYLPLNYHQFTNTYGKMIGIFKVNDGNIFFVFEDATFVTQNNSGLLIDKEISYIGESSIFQRNMRKLPGSQDINSFVTTPYGVFWVNKKLKEFYFYSDNINNITDGIRSWSNEYLKGNIKGIFDPLTENVYWSSEKWTISFKPKAKNWISFHSFLPDKYIQMSKNFLTLKGTAFWKHNVKYDYQSYYNKRYPFIVGININNKFELRSLLSIELYADFIKEYSFKSKEYTNEFFDKAVAYSQTTSTGIQKIIKNEIQSEGLKYTYLKEGKFRLNGFKNYSQKQPILEYSNMEYNFINLNPNNEGSIVGHNNLIHLISEKNMKVLMKLNLSIQQSVIK